MVQCIMQNMKETSLIYLRLMSKNQYRFIL